MISDFLEEFASGHVAFRGKGERCRPGRKIRCFVIHIIERHLIEDQLRRHVFVVDLEALVEPGAEFGILGLQESSSRVCTAEGESLHGTARGQSSAEEDSDQTKDSGEAVHGAKVAERLGNVFGKKAGEGMQEGGVNHRKNMKIAIYPGSFDPVHNGHLDVIERAARLCDRVIVAVAVNRSKQASFSLEERVGLLEATTKQWPGVEVMSFEGLLVDLVNQQNAQAVVRGIRAVSDFEYEFQMALMNRSLDENFETIFLMPSQENIYLSSRIVKEVAALGGNIDNFVPALVKAALAGRG